MFVFSKSSFFFFFELTIVYFFKEAKTNACMVNRNQLNLIFTIEENILKLNIKIMGRI